MYRTVVREWQTIFVEVFLTKCFSVFPDFVIQTPFVLIHLSDLVELAFTG